MIKITFFNPTTLKKRVYKFTIQWDSYNHAYDITLTGRLGNFTDTIRFNPMERINYFVECERRTNEYVTIKGKI